MNNRLKYIARSILSACVSFPEGDLPASPPVETAIQLEHVMLKRIPCSIFSEDEDEMLQSYGSDWKKLSSAYEKFCRSLVALRTTGKIDGATLTVGVDAINSILSVVRHDKTEAEAALKPGHPSDEAAILCRPRGQPSEVAVKNHKVNTYRMYLEFSGIVDSLETLLDGASQLKQAILQLNMGSERS